MPNCQRIARLAGTILLATGDLLPATTHAAQHHVGPDTTYATIQAAVDAASVNDTILIHPGIYVTWLNAKLDPIDFDLVFRSTAGPESTTIDGENNWGPMFDFTGNDITSATRVEGLTIFDCFEGSGGGAAHIAEGADPVFLNCHFIENGNPSYGGAIWINGQFGDAAPLFEDCIFSGNTASTSGGAVYIQYGSGAVFDWCLFDENSQERWDGGGGAVCFNDGSATLSNCTFVENSASQIYHTGTSGLAQFNRCIFAHSPDGPAIAVDNASSIYVQYAAVYGNAGGDSLPCAQNHITYDAPLFCDRASDDYTLCSDTPCHPLHNPWGVWLGCYAVGCGECSTPVEATSWGLMKSLFR